MANEFLAGLIIIVGGILEVAVLCAMGDKSHSLFRKLFKKSASSLNADQTFTPLLLKILIVIGTGLLIAGVIRWMWF